MPGISMTLDMRMTVWGKSNALLSFPGAPFVHDGRERVEVPHPSQM